MFEKKIANEILKCLGILEPSKLDRARFVERFKIDKLGMGRKMILFVSLPAFRKFIDIKLEGVIEDDKKD